MKTLVAIDPGRCTGIAVFGANQLISCWAGSIDEDTLSRSVDLSGSDFVIELPEVYPGARREDPNDLIQVSFTAGRWLERFRATRFVTVKPREWKGQVPKDIHNKRVLALLTPGERDRLPKLPPYKLHNAIDAVGLGLWRLGRTGKGR